MNLAIRASTICSFTIAESLKIKYHDPDAGWDVDFGAIISDMMKLIVGLYFYIRKNVEEYVQWFILPP